MLAGVFAAVPVVVTAFAIWYVETKTRALFRVSVPFLGVVIAAAAIYALGLLVTSLIGRFFLGMIDRVLGRVPVLKDLYAAWKHVSLTPGGTEGVFSKIVMVRDDAGRGWSMGFSSGRPIEGDPNTLCVFLPASPNPTSGRLVFVPMTQCAYVPVSVEEAFKALLSGGNYVPGPIGGAVMRGAMT